MGETIWIEPSALYLINLNENTPLLPLSLFEKHLLFCRGGGWRICKKPANYCANSLNWAFYQLNSWAVNKQPHGMPDVNVNGVRNIWQVPLPLPLHTPSPSSRPQIMKQIYSISINSSGFEKNVWLGNEPKRIRPLPKETSTWDFDSFLLIKPWFMALNGLTATSNKASNMP
jgi:hypothetical protein